MNTRKSPKPSREDKLLQSLPKELRAYGREVLDPATEEDRLREIRAIGEAYYQQAGTRDEASDPLWEDYTDRQLSDMLESPEVPGTVKNEIARFVLAREILPTDKD